MREMSRKVFRTWSIEDIVFRTWSIEDDACNCAQLNTEKANSWPIAYIIAFNCYQVYPMVYGWLQLLGHSCNKIGRITQYLYQSPVMHTSEFNETVGYNYEGLENFETSGIEKL